MQTVSAYILAFNEAEKVKAAVESVLWADEIVVVDSSSTDRTAEIATALGARVVQVPFNGFGDLRNRAIEACRCDWIFSLDADERCTAAVRDEILGLLAGTPPSDAYLVPRRSFMMGRWIRGSGWYPNFRQPQLFRKGSMRYTLEPVHEGYELLTAKPLGTLRNAIWQFPFRNLEEVLRKANRYSSLGAPSSPESASRWRARWATAAGLSSNTIFSSLALSTAGPASSSPLAISKGRITATPSATSKRRIGSRRRANRCGAKQNPECEFPDNNELKFK